jgi:hypothetical protein
MTHSVMLRLLACLFLLGVHVDGRINATNALDIFLISDCAKCVADKNSMFCSAAASDDNWVQNTTTRLTIAQKKQLLGPSDGAKFCWEGEERSGGRAAV